ncbi:MAG: hypothetical protein R3300_17500, partial [Candidatus Promineifilaceae bacterium]|nr:hypothetical protein [Candidatus Promineifilaceae bacterium]
LLYGTYIGGDSPDGATPVLIDASGNLHVGGFTFSSDFFVTHGDDEIDGISDAYVVGIDPGVRGNAALSVEVVNPDGQPVSSLGLNADGWPTPNPLTVTVTITCPAGGNDCSSPFDLELSGGGVGRYYVYEATLLADEGNCVGDSAAQKTSYSSFSVSCETISVQAGSSLTHEWSVWVQPSEASTLEGQATFGQGGDQAIVHVPQAQIHPVVVIPGLMGSMKQGGEWVPDPILHTYDTLIEELQLVGYQDGVSLFTFAYDWRQHLPETGEELGQAISGFLKSASRAQRPYVLTDSVDLVGHSLGGLVSRAYVQGNSYGDDVHRLITLGTPHLGAPQAYLAAEGLDFGEGIEGIAMDIVLRGIAFKHGYCTLIVIRLVPTCIVSNADLHTYIREQVPSVREIFPDRSYMPDGADGYLVSEESDVITFPFGLHVNTFLEDLNRDNDLLLARLGPDNLIAYSGIQGEDDTHILYRVVNRNFWEAPLWENGKVPPDEGFRIEGPGDETVPFNSADLSRLSPSARNIVVSQADNGDRITHGKMPTQLQLSIVEVLSGNHPPFNAGFADEGFDVENALLIVNLSPVDIQIVSPSGQRVGVEFSTGEPINEIPDAFFGRSNLLDEPDFIYIPDASKGTYLVELHGVAEGQYRVQMHAIGDSGGLLVGEVSGSTMLGERHSHTLSYSPSALPPLPLSLEWRPPVQPQEEPREVNPNSSLPIRFTAHDALGDFVVDGNAVVWVADAEEPSHVVAAFTLNETDTRGQSDVLRVDVDEEQYVVVLHLQDYDFEVAKTYTISVMLFGQEIGKTAFTVDPRPSSPGPRRGR